MVTHNGEQELTGRVLEMTTVVFVVIDDAQRLRYLNPAGEVMFGISARKAGGHPLSTLLDIRCDLSQGIARSRERGVPYTERGVELRCLNAGTLTVDCSLIPFDDDYILIEIQQVGLQLRIQNEERLLHQTRATTDLLRGLAHEIKNPLGGLRGAAQLLEGELVDPALKEYTEVIIGESDRLQSLLDQMVGPNRRPHMEQTNIHEVLERVRMLVMAEGSSAGLVIERDYDPSIPSFPADRDLMIQAVLNIVRNAAQMVDSGGVIRLRSRVQRQVSIGKHQHRLVCSLEIEDNGPGIAPELRNTLFLPMVTGRPDGTGLGLSIAQSIVQRQGGVIECDSEPGRTCFTLLIPLET